jgi:hypothetical protein
LLQKGRCNIGPNAKMLDRLLFDPTQKTAPLEGITTSELTIVLLFPDT